MRQILFIAIVSILSAVATLAATAQTVDQTENRYFRGLLAGATLYEDIVRRGGWPALPEGPALRKGTVDARVPLLRRRLALTMDYTGKSDPASQEFDAALEQGVIRFQRRNGIEPDGIVGPETRKTLNIGAAARLKQIRINMHRWHRMPDYLGDRFVLVNQAGYELEVIEGNRAVLEMRVIVGRNYRQTPIFSDAIKYVEINPFWNVPGSIARKDLVPKFAEDPAYPAANGFQVMENGKPVDVAAVDWPSYVGRSLPFMLRQKPGEKNALGRVKIMFPNKYNVYLHDTPGRDLFDKTVRAFSSGCIRLEKPVELVRYLLSRNPPADLRTLEEALISGKTTRIALRETVPVHLVYMTAWLDRDGRMQFRPDIYGRDAKLAAEAGIE